MTDEIKLELTDPDIHPGEEIIKKVLGRSYNAFSELMDLFEKNGLLYEWRYYRDGKAWLCKVQFRKRTIVWMSLWTGFAKATIYLAGKYLDDILKLEISPETKSRILETNNVGKLRPCTFEIRNIEVLKEFEEVMKFKMENK